MKSRLIRFEKMSWKLTWIYSLLFSIVLLLLSIGILYGGRYLLLQQAYETVKRDSIETMGMILDTDNGIHDLLDADLLSEAHTDSDINITIADSQGKIVNQSSNFSIADNDVQSHLGVIRTVETNGMRLLILNSIVSDGSKTIAFLQVALNLERIYWFMKMLLVLLALADALGIVSSVFIGFVLSRKMLKPIDKITKTAQSISINDLERRIPVGNADDELAQLAITFNTMLDRLSDSIRRQSQFVSDASHELRTPISVISGYINLVDRWGKDDRKVLQESVDAIKNEAINMRELIEKLLFLARNDNGSLPVSLEAFDVNDLLYSVAQESMLIAPNKNISVISCEQLMLSADKKLIKQLLRNLVDNSLKFTKPDGKITLKAEATSGLIQIIVQDDGIGIPSEETDRVFDRFYRVDKARSKETGGSGLGLSIAKSIVDAHGGSIRMDSAPDAGTYVTISLPRA